MRRPRGWSSVKPYKVRAVHYTLPDNLTKALCGAPIRTLAGGWKHPTNVCTACKREAKR